MGYTKLDEGILLSSIMACDPKTFKVWIALLAACKPDGIAPVSSVGISSVCRLSLDETKAAIEELSSPDTESRSIQNEGKRIERVDGGYRIINYQKFRELNYKEADAKRKYEERKKKTCPEMSGDMADINASASASASASCIKEGMQGGNDFSTLFLEFWSSYPRKEGKGAAYKSWMKISSPGETLQLILIALEWQKQTEQWKKDNGQYIPMPATYLNQQRWLDEKHKIILPTHILSAGEKQIQKERMKELNG